MMNDYNMLDKFEEMIFRLITLMNANPEQRNDITHQSLFKSLITVKDVAELNRWLTALEKTELSAFNESSLKSEADRCFGEIHVLLITMTEDVLEEAVSLIRKIGEEDYSPYYFTKDVEKCLDISHRLRKENPDAIFLFRQSSGQYAAFDEDAESLYLKFGWELSSLILKDLCSCSFMYVYPKGYAFLKKQNLNLVVMECDYPIDFNTRCRDELILADSQQTIDFFKSLISQKSLVCSSQGLTYSPIVNGLECERRFPFIFKDGEVFGVYDEDGAPYNMIDHAGWNVVYEKIPLINNLALNLSLLMMDEERMKREISPEEVDYDKTLSEMLYIEYLRNKRIHPEGILVMKSSNSAWSFGVDALKITQDSPRTIWLCGGQPVVFFNVNSMPISLHEKNFAFFDSELEVSFERMRLTPHGLNAGVRSSVFFRNPRIFKTMQGDYAIQADVDYRTLPMTKISKNMSDIILSYPEGIMRDTIIKSYLFSRLYDRFAIVSYA